MRLSSQPIAIALFTFVFFNCTCLSAQSPTGIDLDANGSADFLMVGIGGDSALGWDSFTAQGASTGLPQAQLGAVGDHLVPANWADSSKTLLGFIHRSGNKAYWNVANSQGNVTTRALGAGSDTFVAGADFNGNGVSDAATVRKAKDGSGKLEWTIRYDFFKDVDGAAKVTKKKSLKFGKTGDLPFFANYDGLRDWLGVIRQNPSGPGSQIFLLNPAKSKNRKFSVSDYVVGSIRPVPIRLANGKDILALIRKTNSSTIIKFVTLTGASMGTVELAATGDVVVGDYNPAAAGQEIAVSDDSSFLVYNPSTTEQTAVSVPAGIAVDDINVNNFSSTGSGETCDDQTLSPNDGSDNFLWKPVGENSKRLVVLLPNAYTSYIDEVVLRKADGAFIEKASISFQSLAENPKSRTFARFSKPGRKYPDGLSVVAHHKYGCFLNWVIPETSERQD
ncbi:MAG: hypothetical protein K1X79_03285 [Oligoflexia bacterium]|nr:hypothetical protein [Oligoflexia bacterium]